MAVTNEQKIDFLLKKIGYTKTKTGSVVGTGAISGTPKQPFAEAIPSPLVVPNSSLWNEAGSIPATPPGSDTPQVKVYLAASSGIRMTADATSSGQRAYIAYSTYNDTSSARLTNWIDTQFGASYLIKVYKGDPNSGGVALSAAGSGSNDGWFFDYSAGVLNFNDSTVPSGVTDTNIYIVGYRYIGPTGAPVSGISTFSFLDLTVERNLDVGGISTFTGLAGFGTHITLNDYGEIRLGEKVSGGNRVGDFVIRHDPSLYGGTFNVIQSTNGNIQIENRDTAGPTRFLYLKSDGVQLRSYTGNEAFLTGTVNSDVKIYYNNSEKLATTDTGINVTGDGVFSGNISAVDATFSGDVSIGGTLTYEDVTNIDSVGIVTAREGIFLPDEKKAEFGNAAGSGDLQIYHSPSSGNNSFIKHTGSGALKIAADHFRFRNAADNTNILNGVSGDAVTLYFAGNEKLKTTSDGIEVPDAIRHTNDTNTKIRFPADDTISFETAGSEKVRITGIGSVGIGTDDPTEILHIANSGNPKILIEDTESDNQVGIRFKTKLYNWIAGVHGGIDSFKISHSTAFGSNDFFIINGAGNVSILKELDVDGHTNLDNVSVAGVTTFAGVIEGVAGENKIPSLYSAMTNLPSAGSYHGMFAHVHATGRGYFAHAGNWLELVNKETNGTVGTGTETYSIGHITGTGLILNGDIDVDGHTNLDNVSVAGVSTFSNFIYANQGILIRDDNKSILLGTSDDMRIRHTGNHSEITDEGTGDLRLGSNRTVIGNPTFSETQARFIQNGAVELYHDNIKRFETSSVGVSIPQDLDVDGHTNLDNVSITGVSTFASQVRVAGQLQLDSSLKAGGSTGTNGQYLRTTGAGVTWASFPTMRTSQSFTASAGQTTFSFTYNVGFLDVYVNGVKLSSSEFTANNGSSVVLAVGSFVGDIVELISYFTTSYAAGSDTGIENLVEDTSPQLGGNLDLFNKFITGTGGVSITGVITATSFSGTVPSSSLSGALPALDGSALTGIVASGSGVVVKNSGSTVGTAGTIDFGNNLSVSPVSAGIVTITGAAGGGSGISTISGVVNIANDLDVDGHTNLDNVSIAGVSTFTGNADFSNSIDVTGNVNATGNLDLTDSGRVMLGTGDDLQIYHTGSASKIDVYTTGLEIATDGTETLAKFNRHGSVELWHDGTKRFETSSVGVSIPQDLNVDGHTNLDNVSVVGVTTFSSAITVSDIRNNSINLRNASGGASYATFTNGGAAVLKWNNTDRLETTTAGITVTGTVNATAFSGDGSALSNLPGISTTHVRSETLTVSGVTTFTGDVNANKLKFADSNGSSTNIALFGADEDLKIYHSGADSFISDQGTGQLKILTSTLSVKNAGDSTVGLEVVPGSHTKLFFNGSNKIETTNTGAVVTGALTANSFVGDGSGLTNVVGSGSGVIVKDDGSTVGTAGTFDFTSPINITPLSAGITTVGIDTNQFNVNNLDVSGISTFAGNISLAEKIVHTNDSNTSINFPSLDTISFITGGGTRLQVGPVGQLGIAGATYGNPGQVLTSQGSGSIVTWADLPNNVGITTNITGSFTATAGSPSEIHSFVYGNNDRVVEYTILIEQGPSFQSLKVLASRLGSTIHSTQFAVIFNNSLLATFDVIISSSNIRLRAIPETGVTGTIAYRIKREVM